MARVAARKIAGGQGTTTTATTTTTTTPRKENRPPVTFADNDSPLQTPTKQRKDGAYDDGYAVPADDAVNKGTESGLNGFNGPNGPNELDGNAPVETPKRKRGRPRKIRPEGEETVSTPDKRRRTDLFTTPVRSKGLLHSHVHGTMGDDTPTRRTLADRSARRKSTRALIDRMVAADADEDADEDALNDAILSDEEEEEDEDEDEDEGEEPVPTENEPVDDEPAPVVPTPRKRGRPPKKKPVDGPLTATTDGPPPPPKRRPGRPRKNPEAAAAAAREPSPPRELPAHEQYFFQHRAGAAATKTSNSTLAALRLMTHDEYFQVTAAAAPEPTHADSVRALEALHAQSFAQWAFELAQGFGVCLYGYGSKQRLLRAFATALHRGLGHTTAAAGAHHHHHRIVMVDGMAAGGAASVSASAATLREILLVVAAAASASASTSKSDEAVRLPQGTAAAERALLALLDTAATPVLTLVLNGIDAPALRRPAAQATLARLAGHPRIRLLCAADTPSFPLLWDGAARSMLNLVFHDATTFRPLWAATPTAAAAALDPVDEVHALLGRRARRVGGKDGAAFVLRSLPENARALFQLLVGEVLAAVDEGDGGSSRRRGGGMGRRRPLGDDYDDNDEDDYDDDDADADADDDDDDDDGYGGGGGGGSGGGGAPEAIGLEYRMLYNKAVEEFICSSEMSFRTLLKEFHDHQMVTSRKDAFGTELLSLPFRRDELEALLEDLAG